MLPFVRAMISLVIAAAVAWLGGQVLGEYAFEGFVPIAGGGFLGLAVASAPLVVWRGRGVPLLIGLAAAGFAALGEVAAVEIDTADLRPWPWEGYAAVAICGAVGVWRAWALRPGDAALHPPPSR